MLLGTGGDISHDVTIRNVTSSHEHSKKSWALQIVALAVSGGTLYLVLPSIVKVFAAWPRLRNLSPLWIVFSFIAESVSFVCNFLLQKLVLRTNDWFAVVTAGLTGNAVTDVWPGGDAAGATVQFAMLASAGIEPDSAGVSLGAMSLIGVGALLALPLFAWPAIIGGAPVSTGLLHTAILGLIGFCMFAIGIVILLKTDAPIDDLGKVIQWIWNKRPGRHTLVTDLNTRLRVQREAIVSALGQSWKYASLLITGRLGCDYLCLVCGLRATGTVLNPSLVLLAYAATGIIALVPLTPGGLGIVDASLSGMLVLAGVNIKSAVVATLAYRLASYWLPLTIGPVAYLFFRRRYGPVRTTSQSATQEP